MRSQLRSESRQEGPSSPRSRSSSLNSNVTSPHTAARNTGILAVPFTPTPPPAYVAASSASESVQNAVNERLLSDDVSAVVFADAALAQINSFLDCLLYNMLSNARSATLTRIKPSVDVVVKGALGQRAIASAEQELEDLLGDGEDDDEIDLETKERDTPSTWDLDFVFRRTRLRLMVYMSLATMDDDDEERHVQETQLAPKSGPDPEHLSQQTGLVSWKALMFLTAVLEYVAEACLKDAGQFAFARASISRPSEETSTTGTASVTGSVDDRLVVTDTDVRKLNLSPSLGRLWRSWKKVSAVPDSSPRISQNAAAMRRTSAIALIGDESLLQRRPLDTAGVTEEAHVAHDLPRRPNSDQTSSRRPSPLHGPKRSRSFVRFPVAVTPSTAGSWQGSWQSRNSGETVPEAQSRHVRSSSLPPPKLSVFTMPSRTKSDEAPVSATEVASHREAMVVGPSGAGTTLIVEQVQTKDPAASEVDSSDAGAVDTTPPAIVTQAVVPQVLTPVETVQEEDPSLEQTAGKNFEDDGQRQAAFVGQRSSLDDVDESVAEESAAAANDTEAAKADTSKPAPLNVTTKPQVIEEEDEYDPFRVDLAPPVQSPRLKAPASPLPTKTSSPVSQKSPKYVFDDEDTDDNDDIPSRAKAAAVGGVVASGTVAATVAALRNKDKSDLNDIASQGQRTPARGAQISKAQGPQDDVDRPGKKGLVSPLKMSPVQPSDYQQPSGVTTAATSTPAEDKTNDIFVTPPRSPITVEAPAEPLAQKEAASIPPPQPKFSTTKNLGTRAEGAVTAKSLKASPTSGDEAASGDGPTAHSEREFNDFIAANGTVKRTLTPRDLTEIEQPDSSKRRQEAVKSIVVPNDVRLPEAAPHVPQSTAPVSAPAPVRAPVAAAAAAAAAAATAAAKGPRSNTGSDSRSMTVNTGGKPPSTTSSDTPYIPRSLRWSTPQLTSKPSKSGMTARDSRVPEPDGMKELAEFFRSTGPEKPPATPKPFVASSRVVDSAAPKAVVGQISTDGGMPRAKPANGVKKMGSFRGHNERQGNDDLISFLNEGPPGARVNHTKSTETTGSSVNGVMSANRSGSLTSHAPSINESVNSRSNLIGGGRRGGSNPALATESPRTSGQSKAAATLGSKANGGPPMRKQRRVKDPYALDSDEEEEDDILMGLPNKREEGMSMIEFLRSSEPPAREEAKMGPKTGPKTTPTSKLSDKEVAAARAAATASPSIPDFLRDSSRGPSRRASRDSFGSSFKGEKKSRFSFFRSSKVGASG